MQITYFFQFLFQVQNCKCLKLNRFISMQNNIYYFLLRPDNIIYLQIGNFMWELGKMNLVNLFAKVSSMCINVQEIHQTFFISGSLWIVFELKIDIITFILLCYTSQNFVLPKILYCDIVTEQKCLL